MNRFQNGDGAKSAQSILQAQLRQPSGLNRSLSLDAARRNPSCGDRLVLVCRLEDGKLALEWNGAGCSVMEAGASLLVSAINGAAPPEAASLVDQAVAYAEGRVDADCSALPEQILTVMEVFAAKPNRRECLLLAWRAMQDWFETIDMLPS